MQQQLQSLHVADNIHALSHSISDKVHAIEHAIEDTLAHSLTDNLQNLQGNIQAVGQAVGHRLQDNLHQLQNSLHNVEQSLQHKAEEIGSNIAARAGNVGAVLLQQLRPIVQWPVPRWPVYVYFAGEQECTACLPVNSVYADQSRNFTCHNCTAEGAFHTCCYQF